MVRTRSVEVSKVSGWLTFASTMMLVYAGLLLIAGFAGIFNGDSFFRAIDSELLVFNSVAWGWIHLLMGVAFAITGLGLIRKMDWALFSGIFLVMIALLGNLLIIAVYPTWGLTFLLFDAFLLYALMVSGGRRKW